MKTFTLLLNGEDLDTGMYEYFPYIDKSILNFKETRGIVKELKKGNLPKESDSYIYGRYCINRDEDYVKAIESAHRAFIKFKETPLLARRKIFRDMYKLLMKKKEDFINILVTEGHPRKLAEWEFEGMKIGSSPETIDFYFSLIRKEMGRQGSEIVYWFRRPDGVVCLNPPGNASASNSYNAILTFIVGNTLIVKPPIKTPISTIFLWKEVVWEALMNSGVPNGTLNIILGNSQKVLDTWLTSSLVNDIIYFGTSNKGLEIGRKIYTADKKPILELSGNDLFLVWKDANIKGATNSLLDCFLGSTQICMVPKIAVIHKDIYEKFLSTFLKKVELLKFGLPTDPETVFSPVSKIKKFCEFLKDALEKGGRLIYGGNRVNQSGECDENGVYIQPTLVEVDDVYKAKSMRFVQEEIFFPFLPLIRVTGSDTEIFEKMVTFTNTHDYGLRTSLWVDSSKYLRKFTKNIDNCGLLRINIKHVGFSYYLSTHGGTRKSGGPFGEMNYFWHKTSHLQGVTRLST